MLQVPTGTSSSVIQDFACLARQTSLQSLCLNAIPLPSDKDAAALMSSIGNLRQLAELEVSLPRLAVHEHSYREEVPAHVATAMVDALSAHGRHFTLLSKVVFAVDLSWGSSTLESLTEAFCGLPALKQLDLMTSPAWKAPSTAGRAPDAVQEGLRSICERVDVSIAFRTRGRRQWHV